MQPLLDHIRFASDATLSALGAGALFLLAAMALWGDRRRHRRKKIDQVGWMPWTRIFFVCAFLGILLASLAVKGWMAPD